MSETWAEILLATHDGEAYLREQVDSILAQRDGRWHLTLSDDGSTDGTQAILDEYAARYPDRIARYRAPRRFGNARDHFFHLMERCDAPYMLLCDQDDVWYPDKVGRMLDALLAAERERGADAPTLVFSDQTPTDADLRPLAPSLMRMQQQYTDEIDYRALLLQNVVTGGACALNRALARLALRCADASQVVMHDWWLGVVAARFGQAVYLDEPTGCYRQHGGNSVGAKDTASAAYAARSLAKLGEVRRAIEGKKRQAAEFARTYEAALTDEDRAFLLPFAKPRSGPAFYIKNRALIHGRFRLAGMMALG